MGESVATEAAAEDTAAEKEETRRWRPRVPVPVVVTLLVTALTAWVAPAVTRQWDDRQRARELKAALTEEVTVAVAEMLAESSRLARTKRGDAEELQDRWEGHRLRIQAKLRAYMPPKVLTRWNWVSGEIGTFIRVASYLAEDKDEIAADILGGRFPNWGPGLRGDFITPDLDPQGQQELLESGLRTASNNLVEHAEWVTTAILTAEPEGFSTTRVDLLRDLLP